MMDSKQTAHLRHLSMQKHAAQFKGCKDSKTRNIDNYQAEAYSSEFWMLLFFSWKK